MSTLTKHQARDFEARWHEDGVDYWLRATVRHDDRCNNGHNTFSITGVLYECRDGRAPRTVSCGYLHGLIAERIPELAPYIKWHLTSTDGPLHYIANSLYWLGFTKYEAGRIEEARATAVWPEMPESLIKRNGATEDDARAALMARFPQLMADFRAAVESLGFKY